jgi:hypothetical protein
MREFKNFSGDFPDTMRLIEDFGGPINICHWYSDINLGEHLTYALQGAFTDDPPRLSLPITWEEKDNETFDPVMLHVSLPLGAKDGSLHEIMYGCSLEGVVDRLIDLHVNPETNKVEDKEDRIILAKVAVRLRELADKLDSVCA